MKIAMFYFTGTGFTERIARKLSAEFSAQGQETSLNYIPEMLMKMHDAEIGPGHSVFDFDKLGILYPVHSFNAPQIVIRLAKKLPEGNGRTAFIVKTAGSKAEINNASSLLLKKVLKKKGYKVTYEEMIHMPSNFITRPDDEAIRKMVEDAENLLTLVSEEIIKGRRKVYRPGTAVRTAARLGRVEWIGAHLIARFHFKVNDSCNLCGICTAGCPTRNIRIEDGKIRFGLDCTFCMRCIYACPQNAIHLRKPFSGIEIRNWFDLDELMRK